MAINKEKSVARVHPSGIVGCGDLDSLVALARDHPARPGGPTRAQVPESELEPWLAKGWRQADPGSADHGS